MSFTIKCDKCGNESTLIDDFKYNKDDCIVVDAHGGYNGEAMITIDCKCGNNISDDDFDS